MDRMDRAASEALVRDVTGGIERHRQSVDCGNDVFPSGRLLGKRVERLDRVRRNVFPPRIVVVQFVEKDPEATSGLLVRNVVSLLRHESAYPGVDSTIARPIVRPISKHRARSSALGTYFTRMPG